VRWRDGTRYARSCSQAASCHPTHVRPSFLAFIGGKTDPLQDYDIISEDGNIGLQERYADFLRREAPIQIRRDLEAVFGPTVSEFQQNDLQHRIIAMMQDLNQQFFSNYQQLTRSSSNPGLASQAHAALPLESSAALTEKDEQPFQDGREVESLPLNNEASDFFSYNQESLFTMRWAWWILVCISWVNHRARTLTLDMFHEVPTHQILDGLIDF